MLKKCGVYKITNIRNGKYYIGSSKNIHKRKQAHLRELRRGNHKNERLQNAFNAYGEDSFILEVLEFTSEKAKYEREQFYIDKYDAYNRDVGYNICPVALGGYNPGELNGMYGKTHTEEVKQRLSYLNSGENHVNAKAVNQYDLEGKYITTYGSAREAAKALNVAHSHIVSSCTGKYKTGCGFIWLYKDKATASALHERLKLLKAKVKTERSDRVPIVQLGLNLNLIQGFNSIYEASNALSLDISSICSCCKGKIKTCGGYVFVYKRDFENDTYKRDVVKKRTNKQVVQLTRDNSFVNKFDSIKLAEKKLNISTGSISKCCNGKMKTAGGFKWMFYSDYLNKIS